MEENLILKTGFVDFEFTCSDGVTYSFAEVDWSIPEGITAPPSTLDPAACSATEACVGVFGNCCPTDDGVFLGCCGDVGDLPTEPPTPRPTPRPTSGTGEVVEEPTFEPTDFSTDPLVDDSITEVPVVDDPTETPLITLVPVSIPTTQAPIPVDFTPPASARGVMSMGSMLVSSVLAVVLGIFIIHDA
jgi:hypothetical protein